MTKPTDYSGWTYEDHLVVAGELAARADAAAETTLTPSQAAQQRESILQTCARGQLHAKLAELKKPETQVELVPTPVPAALDMAVQEAVAPKTKPQQRTQRTGPRDAGQ